MTTKETAAKWKVSDRRILQYCNAGRIIGAEKIGEYLAYPKSAKKPADRRYKENMGEIIKQKEDVVK